MIAVDTNIIIYFYLEGEFTELAEKTFKKDSHWVAPFLWRSEFRNVLAVSMRKKIITLEDAFEMIQEAELLMKGNEYSVTSSHVLQLVNQSKCNCTAYDCEFVALARDLYIPLVTMDKEILRHFPETAVRLDHFAG
ncbi:MAG: PIN domain-containing protein [Candidatus Aminicenantes bacterium]|nr:PIN domain-containing protein [Candidatus Aminicenantes bacterium]NIM77703.1 PIN domain-containing protein [Candidatus Aminicenantes bacterium]NIN17016.1 PIN domain-containing protein [Candidatus Aminicenantes bacterium]NIN40909.1 PIN domain-containing protein [Candidatus Aminicenantes bacterium]NIN83714.1 PIN domain-containing protein [Candidatus Aminicenantes bacterium]